MTDKQLVEAAKKITSYEEWKVVLIEVTKRELSACGYHSPHLFKINDSEAIKCYNSGMSPLQTFRETYEQ